MADFFFSVRGYAILTSQYDSMSVTSHDEDDDGDDEDTELCIANAFRCFLTNG